MGLRLHLALSVFLLWLEVPAFLLPALRWLHDALTVVLGLLVAGHIALAALHPRTRPALGGMLDGRVPAEWARHHYPGWIPEATADGERKPRVLGRRDSLRHP